MNEKLKKRSFSLKNLALSPFPSFAFFAHEQPPQPRDRLLPIQSAFSGYSGSKLSIEPFVFYMEKVIENMIPASLLEKLVSAQHTNHFDSVLDNLFEQLPLISWSDPQTAPSSFCVTLLCIAEFTQGVGRHFTDTLSRWLIPGKLMNVFSAHSLNFHFKNAKKHPLFIHQIVMDVRNEKELSIIKTNLPKLIREIQINVCAVRQARKVMASSQLTSEQKRAVIEESIATLLEQPSKKIDSNIFDQMHHFLNKVTGEDREAKMQEGFVSLLEHKPTLFDRDIFNEIRHFVLLFRDNFSGKRPLRHLGRIISYQYFFRKSLIRQVREKPQERHLQLKLFKTRLTLDDEKKDILSLLIGINTLQENELFEKRHIISAIESCSANIKIIPDSFVVDRRSSDKIRIFYVEFTKTNDASFSLTEMKQLRHMLPRELNGKIENVIHPVLLSRNEEEVMRTIILLSSELKYVHDIPQVYISFDTQIGQHLSFTVILLRLVHHSISSLKNTLSHAQTTLKCYGFEVKEAGFLRKRYPKEANVFRVEIDKSSFLRKDFSLDLYKARLLVVSELTRLIGEFRDYNGGILSKEQEALLSLKNSLEASTKSNDFLVENFFYSITPPVMRSILYTSHLQTLYRMMLHGLDHNYSNMPFWIQTTYDGDYALFMISSPSYSFKDPICNLLNQWITTLEVSYTYADPYNMGSLGIIARCDDESTKDKIYHTLQATLQQTFELAAAEVQ
jgi:hypothetical protein